MLCDCIVLIELQRSLEVLYCFFIVFTQIVSDAKMLVGYRVVRCQLYSLPVCECSILVVFLFTKSISDFDERLMVCRLVYCFLL